MRTPTPKPTFAQVVEKFAALTRELQEKFAAELAEAVAPERETDDLDAILDRARRDAVATIEAWLKLRASEADREAPQMLHLANRLYGHAKHVRERWEGQVATMAGAMRAAATNALEADRDRGARTKMITDADVEAACARLFPDEYAAQRNKGARLRQLEHDRASLVTAVARRCRQLESTAERKTGKR